MNLKVNTPLVTSILNCEIFRTILCSNENFIGGENHVVEIDESLFSKRKYNVGRLVLKKWVVGGIDLFNGKSFFVETFRRDKETLNSIVLNHVAKGTIVVTDKWKGYNGCFSLFLFI